MYLFPAVIEKLVLVESDTTRTRENATCLVQIGLDEKSKFTEITQPYKAHC